jgi:hypothetical protein
LRHAGGNHRPEQHALFLSVMAPVGEAGDEVGCVDEKAGAHRDASINGSRGSFQGIEDSLNDAVLVHQDVRRLQVPLSGGWAVALRRGSAKDLARVLRVRGKHGRGLLPLSRFQTQTARSTQPARRAFFKNVFPSSRISHVGNDHVLDVALPEQRLVRRRS